MKKILFAMGVMLAATFTLTNCTKELQNPQDVKTPYTIYANTAETKTANDGLSTVWVEGDALNVFATAAGSTEYGTSSKFTLTDAASGKFETDDLKAELAATNDWYALYPYSQYVTTPASTDAGYIYFGNKNGLTQEEYNSTSHLSGSTCPLYGVAEAVAGTELPAIEMQHLTSVVKINVTNGTSSTFAIKDLSFTSSAGDIVGHYFVDFTQDVPVLTPRTGNVSNTASLTVTNPSDLAPSQTASFYIVVRPFTAPANSTLTIKIGSVEKTKTLAEEVVFAAGKIKGINYTLKEVPVEVPPTKATVEDFLAAAEDDTWYELTGTISNLTNTTFGNFDLTDATGKVYVYGLTKTKVASNDRSFASIGLKEGDVVTLIGKRSSHNGTPQVGGPAYYVSHVAGEEPEPEPGTGELTHPLTSNLLWTLGVKAYESTVAVNGNEAVAALKLGTGSVVGNATITIPAGTTKVGFYGVAWNGAKGTITASAELANGVFYSQDLTANAGAAGSTSNYTMTASDSDYYEINVVSILGAAAPSDIPVTISTVEGALRAIIWGLNYYTASGIGADQSGSEPEPDPEPEPTPGAPASLITATVAEFLAAAESTDTWYKLTGEIVSIAKADYGNFTIKDETGEVYIYGMTNGWVGSNDKSFSAIGLKVGDIVTLGTLRGSHNGTPQGGGNTVPAYYISHVEGETPEVTVEGSGTEADPYTVADVIALHNSGAAPADAVWIEGDIVGYYNSNTSKFCAGTDGAVASNLALGTSDVNIPVQLPSGNIRKALNLLDNPGNLGKTVAICGKIQAYFSVAGIKSPTDYKLN